MELIDVETGAKSSKSQAKAKRKLVSILSAIRLTFEHLASSERSISSS
jgi:hypothetical protein